MTSSSVSRFLMFYWLMIRCSARKPHRFYPWKSTTRSKHLMYFIAPISLSGTTFGRESSQRSRSWLNKMLTHPRKWSQDPLAPYINGIEPDAFHGQFKGLCTATSRHPSTSPPWKIHARLFVLYCRIHIMYDLWKLFFFDNSENGLYFQVYSVLHHSKKKQL